jgi:NitT/TauT family transport system substrate-binding protein
MKRKILFSFLATIFLFSGCVLLGDTPENTPSESDENLTVEPIKLKIGILPFSSYLPLYIAQAEGYFAEQGLDVEIVDFTRQVEIIPALITKQIDVTGLAVDAATLSAMYQEADLKIVADKGVINANAKCSYGGFLANMNLITSGDLNDPGSITEITFIFPPASQFEYMLDQALLPFGLTTSAVTTAYMPTPTIFEAFQTGEIDVAHTVEPWLSRIVETGKAEIWHSYEDLNPGGQLSVIIFGPSVTQENTEAGNRFLAAYMQAVQQYNQGKTDRNIELMAEFTNSDLASAASSCWLSFNPDGSVNLESILDFQEWAIAKGYVDNMLTVDQFWDGSYLNDYYQNNP